MAANWYDFIPGVSNVAGAVNGDWGRAIFGVGDAAKDYFFDDPANTAKAAYDQAIGQSQASGKQIRDFLMGQQEKALGFYQPMQQLFNQTYGSSGIQAPQIPRATGGR